MLDKIDASLRKFNKSAESTKHAVEEMKGLDPKSMAAVFDLIDERVEKTAELIRSEVEESQQKLRRELEEDRRLERKHQKKLLLLNIAVASMAVVTFLFQRVLG
ncbi:hypothetical protein MHO82_24380 [Vibrio sp. Of7-15]|uniref:hypothetical protein n=1 Tax=Vibrio sp. Of7-15 TaxID=2724879 RepID=UPI001EF2BC4B|nr:hypothetical protein [Vibrio sp. Of7-15]MCG7500004.1 hypothetical protein [Vibrio sp. Of7-15]